MNKDLLKLANVESIINSKSLQGAKAGNRSCSIKNVFKNFAKLTGKSFWLESIISQKLQEGAKPLY